MKPVFFTSNIATFLYIFFFLWRSAEHKWPWFINTFKDTGQPKQYWVIQEKVQEDISSAEESDMNLF